MGFEKRFVLRGFLLRFGFVLQPVGESDVHTDYCVCDCCMSIADYYTGLSFI